MNGRAEKGVETPNGPPDSGELTRSRGMSGTLQCMLDAMSDGDKRLHAALEGRDAGSRSRSEHEGTADE